MHARELGRTSWGTLLAVPLLSWGHGDTCGTPFMRLAALTFSRLRLMDEDEKAGIVKSGRVRIPMPGRCGASKCLVEISTYRLLLFRVIRRDENAFGPSP